MNEYIFYTPEGYTYPPKKDTEAENCQVLGRVLAKDEKEAKFQLEEELPWIKDCGFNISKAICKQIVNDDMRDTLKLRDEMIEYLINLLDGKQSEVFNKWLLERNE
ncbi:MAG: hypothetical protein IJZ92_04115 [Bacteroidaceae bacterium]|nr:hypothetical protein [Bacteroidaceae bacterium]